MVAAATITSTQYATGGVRASTGLNYLTFKIGPDFQFHNTVSQTLLIAKLPPVCEILACWVKGTNAGTTAKVCLRVEDTDCSITLTTASLATPAADLGHDVSATPFRVSLSDDAAHQYARLRLEATASAATTTISLAGVLLYTVGAHDLG